MIREACVEGIDQALKAEEWGADRIELCSRLDLDGLTPDFGTIEQARSKLGIPIRVMIRPRGGNFSYNDEEIKQMKEAIAFCREQEVEGVVFGTLNDRLEIDLDQVNELVDEAGTLKTVFHRAIESTGNIADSVILLRNHTQVDAILVSGTGGGQASEHITELKNLIRQFNGRELVVCGKVTRENLPDLHAKLAADAYHGKKIVGDLTTSR